MGLWIRIKSWLGIGNGVAAGSAVESGTESDEKPVSEEVCRVIAESDEIVRFACGHDGPAEFSVSFWGERKSPRPEILARREECGECMIAGFRPDLIRCALCGFAIGPGDGVALYTDDGHFREGWKTVVEERGHKSVIGCMRWDCCPSGAFFVGNWDGGKIVYRFPDGVSAAGQALRIRKPVVTDV
jgi:hypothetical protein